MHHNRPSTTILLTAALTTMGGSLSAQWSDPALRIDFVRSAPTSLPLPGGDALAFLREDHTGSIAREVGIWVGVVGVGLGASVVGDPPPLECPCDRNEVPFFDRWAITGLRDGWDILSTGTLVAAAGVAWGDTFIQGGGLPRLGASVESAAVAVAATEILKNATHRRRPLAYAENDLTGVDLIDAHRSFPSGHTSTAFAVATSYWLGHPGPSHRTTRAIVGIGAALTGVLRVVAGRHFPTDVVAAAGVGVGSAVLVHTIRF